MTIWQFKISFLSLVIAYIDLDTSFTNHRFSAADMNGWQFSYELYSNDAVIVQGLTRNKGADLERSQCLTQDGSCTDVNAVQYVGLGILGQFGGTFKTFENIPPHSQIYFSADVAVRGKQIPPAKVLAMFDTLNVFAYTFNPGSMELFYEATSFQGIYPHSYPFLQVQFISGFVDKFEKSMGIRNIQIKYTPCPVGCLICSTKETQTQCSQWILNFEGMRFDPSTFNNEGWQIINSKELLNIPQDFNVISYSFCMSTGLGPLGLNQDANKILFLDPHYEVRFVFQVITLYIDTRSPHVIVVRIDGLEVYSFNIKNVGQQFNFCQWDSYEHDDRKRQQMTKRIDFNIKSTKRQIQFSLRMQSISLPVILDKFILKDFQVYIKRCYSEPNFSCDECVGPEKKDCIQKTKVVNFQQIAAKDFTAGHGWQVILPEQGGIIICNQKYYFGLDTTKVTTYQIQKFLTIKEDHQEIQISFTVSKIDKYVSEKLQIYLDDTMIDEILFQSAIGNFNFCGTTEVDGYIYYTKKITHTRSLSLIQIRSTQTTNVAYFGISNFKLQIRNGQESQDLYKDLVITPILAANNWNDWVITQFSNELSQYICDSTVTILGKLQPEMQIRRFIKSIPNHTQMRIQFTTYLFTDKFQGTFFILNLNNQTIWNEQINWMSIKRCNANLDSFILKGDIIVDHDLDYAFFIWKSSVSDLSASWGIADFKLFIS